MTDRLAVLIGADAYDHAPRLRGAVQDVVDLTHRLLDRGVRAADLRLLTSPELPDHVLPDVPRAEATRTRIEHAVRELAQRTTDDDTVLIHVSGRGLTTAHGPSLVCADGEPRTGRGLLPIRELTAPFAHLPVRSVLTVLDVGFGGGADTTRTLAWPAHPSTSLDPTDPVVLANGLTGPVYELELDGAVRGGLSYALGRCLDVLPADCDWTFARLMNALRSVQTGLPRAQSAVLLPPTDTPRMVGALLGGQQHVPWRGVQAAWQWIPTHDYWPDPTFRAGPDMEQFDFGTQAPFSQNQYSWGTRTGGGQLFNGPGVYSFDNTPFDLGQPVQQAPTAGQGDKVYIVTADFDLGGDVFMVVRNASDPQSIEWYTTAHVDFLPIEDDGTVTITQGTVPSFGGPDWFRAVQGRR